MLSLNRQSVIKLTPFLREGGENNETAKQIFIDINTTTFPIAPTQYKEGTWQNEGPLDVRVKPASYHLAKDERPTWRFP